jgi:predicted SprT family Zn-dependent metalloprotease
VLTHELAHLIAFEKYGRRISPMVMNGKKLSEICF